MTKNTMSRVWIASEWNQPDNCWRRASVKLLESLLKSETEQEWGRRSEMKRCKRLGIHESFLSFFLHLIPFSDLNNVLNLGAGNSVKLTKKNCAVREYVELGRWRGLIWNDERESVTVAGERTFCYGHLTDWLLVAVENNIFFLLLVVNIVTCCSFSDLLTMPQFQSTELKQTVI